MQAQEMPRGSLTWVVMAALGLVLAACGGHPPAPPTAGGPAVRTTHSQGYYKVGKPYQIDGTWYYPREDWSYDETGIASWYGEQFHGRYTADGEIFDLNEMTAAHRTLPMPVVVRVTNLDNGRSIKLRVNDRGPYARGRIIDVSRRAAQMLGFERSGTAKVRVQIDVPDSMEVATAAGRPGGPPSVGMAVAEVVSAPLTLPVSAIEAMRGKPETRPLQAQTQPPPPQPQAQPVAVAVASQPQPPSSAPAAVKIADNALIAPRPIAREPAPRPSRMSSDRPYLIDDLPGEPGASPPAQQVAAADPPPLPAKVEMTPVHQTQIYIQAGAFTDQNNAVRLSTRLASIGSPVNIISGVTGAGAPIFRVRLGPVASVDDADALLTRVMANGIAQARIVVD
jgi:rare lipoprotein A